MYRAVRSGSRPPHTGALASQGTAIPVEGCYPHQGGNLLAVEGAQLGKAGYQGGGDDWSYSWDTSQQLGLFLPQRTGAQEISLIPVQLLSHKGPTLQIRATMPTQLFGLYQGRDVTTLLSNGLPSLRPRLTRPVTSIY